MWTWTQTAYCALIQAGLSCRAAMPVVTAAVAVFVERKIPSKTEATALLLLVSGVIISVFEGQASGSSYGITLSITGKPHIPCDDPCGYKSAVLMVDV